MSLFYLSFLCKAKKQITRNCTQYSLTWVFLHFVHVVFLFVSCVLLLVLSCLVCIVVSCLVCIVVVVMCVLLSSNVFLCTCCTVCVLMFFTLVAELLARSQYSEGPATGHFDTGFSRFLCD